MIPDPYNQPLAEGDIVGYSKRSKGGNTTEYLSKIIEIVQEYDFASESLPNAGRVKIEHLFKMPFKISVKEAAVTVDSRSVVKLPAEVTKGAF